VVASSPFSACGTSGPRAAADGRPRRPARPGAAEHPRARAARTPWRRTDIAPVPSGVRRGPRPRARRRRPTWWPRSSAEGIGRSDAREAAARRRQRDVGAGRVAPTCCPIEVVLASSAASTVRPADGHRPGLARGDRRDPAAQPELDRQLRPSRAGLMARPHHAVGTMAAMTRRAQLNLTIDFCLRVGELLLSSGAGAADVTATMQSLARHLRRAHPDDRRDVHVAVDELPAGPRGAAGPS
jgi:hypothetical protein